MRNSYLLATALLLLNGLWLHAQPADTLFAHYFRQAQAFADHYPREKVYLHLDNTSYYLGDTIWFKAYAVLAEGNVPTPISKPLYVELLDQLGNVTERQVVRLTDGEGHGQIALNKSFFTGYYELRAYTKWMLAFDEPGYFSRVLPIYRQRLGQEEAERSIATYRMDESMEQRPTERRRDFDVRFFPEGGNLVQGLNTAIAFEAVGNDGQQSEVSGRLLSADGKTLGQLQSLHQGMGYFMHRPGANPAVAEFTYRGDVRRFKLPDALEQGYAIQVSNMAHSLNVTVMRSSAALTDTLALFLSSHGRPHLYAVIDFNGKNEKGIRIPTGDLPKGVVQLSLLKTDGSVLCDRFCFLQPDRRTTLTVDTDQKVYRPHQAIDCRIRATDLDGRPLQTHFSVAIRDGINSDYREFDNTICTDLLLTSDLKGYIHQPGFYFAERSAGRRKLLDLLLMIRGWRQYDMQQLIGGRPFKPRYLPEQTLRLDGQAHSLHGKLLRNVGLSIVLSHDTVSVAGTSVTDSLGNFSLPIDDFNGTLEAYIQTRNEGKKRNKMSVVSLARQFAPPLRSFSAQELHPQWEPSDELKRLLAHSDSLYRDSLLGPNHHLLDEVVVNAKQIGRQLKQTKRFEQNILGYYDLQRVADRMRDEGKPVTHLVPLLKELNPNFRTDINDQDKLSYNTSPIRYLINGGFMSLQDAQTYVFNDVDALRTLMLYYDQGGGSSMYMLSKHTNRVVEGSAKDFWRNYNSDDTTLDMDASEMAELDTRKAEITDDEEEEAATGERPELPSTDGIKKKQSVVVCSITTIDDWDPGKSHKIARGIRYTQIQAYNRPVKFYSPSYPDGAPLYADDYRRTLYWNPSVSTDSQGNASVRCYNAGSSAPLTIRVEGLYQGMPIAN